MKKSKLIISTLIIFIALTFQLPAKTVAFKPDIQPVSFEKALDLYNASNFIAAEKIFLDLLKQTPIDDPVRFDLDYYRLMCLVKQNKNISENEIIAYLSNTNGSPWENQLWFELAKFHFSNRRYKQAARTFKHVDPEILSRTDREDYAFYQGYSNFEAGNLKIASQAFFEVRKSNSIYASSASYYWGYINYLEGNYQTALDEFVKLQNNPKFAGFIKYYTIQIYYLQGKYQRVTEMGEKLIGEAPEEQKNELYKIVGDAFYETGRYINAIKYLDAYQGINGKKTPEDYFRLGYSYYQMKDYHSAITAFEKSTIKNDTLAQNAYYHLADCYLKTNDKNKARIAFEQASEYSFDPRIEEDALFNYAKLTYELSYSPFNETIKAFDEYITKYPDSERNDAAFDYLVKVYMTTKNYRDAISSIEKIKNQTPSVKEAYQRVTYYRGLELFNDGHYQQALKYFSKSLENGEYNRTYKVEALYWSGETYYRIQKFDKAIALFKKFQSTPGAFGLKEFGTAYYNIGYCYFNTRDFKNASTWFRKYLNQSIKDKRMEADAANRIGDAYYLNREFSQAADYYNKACQLKSYDPDYALFKIAECKGLGRNYEEKIKNLEQLIKEFPKSSYLDDALFEIAKTNERTGAIDKAIAAYQKLNTELPQSNFNKKAWLQLGLIYYNKEDYNLSLENYKKVIEKYPNSEEAKSALIGIKNNYVEMNNVDGYFAYVNHLGNHIAVSANQQDSVFYMAAEKSYMEGDQEAGRQLEEYLKRFPNGSFEQNALFYLAEFNYGKGKYTKALGLYEEVVAKPDDIFTEQSLIKAAELTFNAAKYDKSLEYFSRLEQLSSSQWNLLKARLGIMRCYYALEQPANTVKAATTLLATENITDLMKREANYKLAKSYYLLHEKDEALKYFTILAADTKSAEGAESKYYKAQIMYDKKQYADCENEIMDFISKNTPHQYWLAKSFILLSDVYLSNNDLFQAKHTLKSIIDNYTVNNDGIIDEAKRKIQLLEAREKETVITNDEAVDSTQNF